MYSLVMYVQAGPVHGTSSRGYAVLIPQVRYLELVTPYLPTTYYSKFTYMILERDTEREA